MIHTIAQYGPSKVLHNDVSGEFVLLSKLIADRNYSNNKVDVVLFEENPMVQAKLMEQVLAWRESYRINHTPSSSR